MSEDPIERLVKDCDWNADNTTVREFLRGVLDVE